MRSKKRRTELDALLDDRHSCTRNFPDMRRHRISPSCKTYLQQLRSCIHVQTFRNLPQAPGLPFDEPDAGELRWHQLVLQQQFKLIFQ